jgi:assimilatory nitrate reductase catalytic subunit
VLLPAAGWGEKDGTVTNSERRVSRQRPFLPLPGEVRPDWWIISQVAKRMGFAHGFAYFSPGQIFAEHAGLSAFENEGSRDFDLSGLASADYATMPPTQWPVRQAGTKRMFADARYFTPDHKARFVTVQPPPPIVPAPGQFVLNTGRVRDHWHTMTRTGKTARLSAHIAEPFVEINPADAEALSIRRTSLVRLENRHGSALLRALVSDRQPRGQVFVPMHWTDQFASNGRIDALVTGKVDPVSGQPALKMARVTLSPAHVRIYGFFVSRARPALAADYWAVAEASGGVRGELAWFEEPRDWEQSIRASFGLADGAALNTVFDRTSGRRAYVAVENGRLAFALYLSPDPVLVSRQWVVSQLTREDVDGPVLLAGRPGADVPDQGAIVCSCMGVGVNTIVEAVTKSGCSTVEAVGALTTAGTNCGSCRAEIRGLIDAHRLAAAE